MHGPITWYVYACAHVCVYREYRDLSRHSRLSHERRKLQAFKRYSCDNLITRSLIELVFLLKTAGYGSRVSIGFASIARESKMERNLVKTLDDTYDKGGIVGCILADHAGLCLGVKGDASSDSAGLIAAIADLVAKLEPKSGSPIISLQNDNRQCIILRKEPVVGAIYKDIST